MQCFVEDIINLSIVSKLLHIYITLLFCRGRIYILYWRRNWGLPGWGWKDHKDLGDCVVTYDRQKIKDAEAVVFHFSGLDVDEMPWQFYR